MLEVEAKTSLGQAVFGDSMGGAILATPSFWWLLLAIGVPWLIEASP
jgi:hypothetical protein